MDMALHIEMFITASPKRRRMCSQGLSRGWRRLHSSITGKCSTALNNHVCLCVGTLNWTLSPTADLLIKRAALCSDEQSNKGKIAFRQKYLNLFNVLCEKHCENWSRIGKEGYMCGCKCQGEMFTAGQWPQLNKEPIVADVLLHWSRFSCHFCLEALEENGFSTFYGLCYISQRKAINRTQCKRPDRV